MFNFMHFGSTFQDRKLNGFDIMVMESATSADKIISQYKKEIDEAVGKFKIIVFSYNNIDILESDQRRIKQEILEYAKSKGIIIVNDKYELIS